MEVEKLTMPLAISADAMLSPSTPSRMVSSKVKVIVG
jgi:hypothetical protein